MCGRQALLPKSLQISFSYNRLEVPRYRGGYADVWVGDHGGRQVAVKVLRVYSTSDFKKITSVGCLHSILNIRAGKLTATHVGVLQGSHDMENPSPSKCVATLGSHDEQRGIHNGIGVDDKWEHQ